MFFCRLQRTGFGGFVSKTYKLKIISDNVDSKIKQGWCWPRVNRLNFVYIETFVRKNNQHFQICLLNIGCFAFTILTGSSPFDEKVFDFQRHVLFNSFITKAHTIISRT